MTVGLDAVAAPPRFGARLPHISEARFGTALFWLALAVGAAWRVWFASVDDSIYWPDEIYQSLEPAHGIVHGYGFRPWEYKEGARSWFFPGVLAGFLWTFDRLGLERPAEYMPAFKLLFSMVGLLTAWGCWSLARSLGAGRSAAAAAAAVFALAAPLIYFSPRALGETASAAPVVWAFALALRPGADRRALVWAAVLLTAAVLIRLQNGLFCLGLLAVLAEQRRWKDLRFTFAALCVGAVYFGALDWISWGRPFHSALVYLKFNLIDGKASQFGTAPWSYYVEVFSTAMPVLSALGAALFIAGLRRAPALSWTALAALILLWLIPHKEFRFVVPVLPLFCAVAALGVDRLGQAMARWGGPSLVAAGVVAAGLASAWATPQLTFRQLGQITEFRPADARALDYDGAANRLLMAAHDRPDLCGLIMPGRQMVWSGGYTHLHRRTPLMGEPEGGQPFNYAITQRDPARLRPGLEGRTVAVDGDLALVRLSDSNC
jgi:hypothetical protein